MSKNKSPLNESFLSEENDERNASNEFKSFSKQIKL